MDYHVLIVDDMSANLALAREALKPFYKIATASSAEEAFVVLERFTPDLILLDIMMPGMDGFEFCRHLKASDRWCDIPVIYLTALGQVESVVKGLDLGAVDYITKPFQISELQSRVKTQIRMKQQVDEIARLRREHESFLRHELNNRLMPIGGYADLLLRSDLQIDTSHKEMLETILEQVQELASLIASMKDLEELENGTHVINRSQVDLHFLVSSIVDALSVQFEGIHFNYVHDEAAAQLMGDAVLLRGVFLNLIKNAAEHVRNLPSEEEQKVNITVSQTETRFEVTIQNGGAPIPFDKLKSFFDKFNSDRSQKADGTGLGTTYAYWGVRAHQGHIEVVSNAADGTVVTVFLPKSDSE